MEAFEPAEYHCIGLLIELHGLASVTITYYASSFVLQWICCGSCVGFDVGSRVRSEVGSRALECQIKCLVSLVFVSNVVQTY